MEEMNKDQFIHELARKARFTVSDARAFMKAFEELIAEAVMKEVPLNLKGFGRMKIVTKPAFRGYNARKYRLAKEADPSVSKDDPQFYEDFPESKKLSFVFGQNFRDLLRPPDKRKCNSNAKQIAMDEYFRQQEMDEIRALRDGTYEEDCGDLAED